MNNVCFTCGNKTNNTMMCPRCIKKCIDGSDELGLVEKQPEVETFEDKLMYAFGYRDALDGRDSANKGKHYLRGFIEGLCK